MKLFAYILTLAAILGLIYQKEWVWLFFYLVIAAFWIIGGNITENKFINHN